MPAAQRRDQIVEAAANLFGRRGFGRMSMKQIAAACHVTEAALYRHFASKEELYEAAVLSLRSRLGLDRFLEKLEAQESLDEILTAVANYILVAYTREPEIGRLLMHCALDEDPVQTWVYRDLRGPLVAFIQRRLERMKEAGLIRDVQCEVTARCFVGMIMDCCLSNELWTGIQGRRFSRDLMIRNNVNIYVHGLLLRSPDEAPSAASKPRRERR